MKGAGAGRYEDSSSGRMLARQCAAEGVDQRLRRGRTAKDDREREW